jgi:hypothetical protein
VNLTTEQIDAIDRGEPVRDVADGRDVVVLGAKVFERIQGLFAASELDREEVGALISRNMAELDAGDPTLDSYQIYK